MKFISIQKKRCKKKGGIWEYLKLKMTIEEYAKVKLEIRVKEDVKGMSWEQREVYLSSVASLIDGMLKEEPSQVGLDTPMDDEKYFEQHPYDEGFFRT